MNLSLPNISGVNQAKGQIYTITETGELVGIWGIWLPFKDLDADLI